jgi:uncharacterized protein (DUF1778 family)
MKKYARLTIDMTPEEHTYLKMAGAQLGVSMRKFMLLSAFRMMKELDDEWLAARAEETIQSLSSSANREEELQESDMSLT